MLLPLSLSRKQHTVDDLMIKRVKNMMITNKTHAIAEA